MASAFLAIFSLTRRRFLEHANVFGTGCNLYGIGVPKRKRIDWGCRPRTARAAMTIAHGLWCSRHLYLDRPAKAFALVCHMPLPSLWLRPVPQSQAVSQRSCVHHRHRRPLISIRNRRLFQFARAHSDEKKVIRPRFAALAISILDGNAASSARAKIRGKT